MKVNVYAELMHKPDKIIFLFTEDMFDLVCKRATDFSAALLHTVRQFYPKTSVRALSIAPVI